MGINLQIIHRPERAKGGEQKAIDVLKDYFVKDFEIVEEWKKKMIVVQLNMVRDPINDIPEVKFYSKPSRPWYVGYKDLHSVAGGKWIWIISTNQWLMPTHIAKQKKLWGELIAEIY